MRWIWLGLVMGCAPKVNVEVLEPAAKTLPEHVKAVAALDRGQSGSRLDKDAAAEAEAAMAKLVARSPRFEVTAITQEQALAFDAIDRTLEWPVVEAICTRVGAQAVVALEAVESSSDISEDSEKSTYTDDKGKEHITLTWTATRRTEVETSWKIYDLESKEIIDDISISTAGSWDAQGPTPAEARTGLPDLDGTVLDLAWEGGEDYARRIAPTWIRVSRDYYPSGSARMKKATDLIEAGKLQAAAEIWEKIAAQNDEKLTAKANYNLGVAWEGQGNLRQAIDHVAAADKVLDNGRTRAYLALLRQRKIEKKTLKEQMAPVRSD